MKLPSVIAFVFLLLSLILMLTWASTSFDYIQSAYATDAGGDAGDAGDSDGGGGDDFNWSLFLDDDNANTLHIVELKKGQNKITEEQLRTAVDMRDRGVTVVFVGTAKGFEERILWLAEYNINAAAKLLTRWSRLKARDYKGMLAVLKRMIKSAKKDLKKAKQVKEDSKGIIDYTPKFESTIFNLEAIQYYIENDLVQYPSDVRLKKQVTHIATLDSGIRLYSFRYLWDDKIRVGVMAQDLLGGAATRQAVSTMPGGFYAVNYEMLGLKMTTLDAWREQGLASVLLEPATTNASALPAAFAD